MDCCLDCFNVWRICSNIFFHYWYWQFLFFLFVSQAWNLSILLTFSNDWPLVLLVFFFLFSISLISSYLYNFLPSDCFGFNLLCSFSSLKGGNLDQWFETLLFFLLKAFKAIYYFPVSAMLATSHKFWNVFLLSFSTKYFLSLVISSSHQSILKGCCFISKYLGFS